jgi:hypothetical protein
MPRGVVIHASSARLRSLIQVFVGLSCALYCCAQSPPLGPPLTTNTQFDVGAGLLTGIVNNELQQALSQTNATLQQQGYGARVSALPMQFWSPYRLPTQYLDKPNQWYVKLPIMIGIQVHVPDWFDRQIYVPLDLNVSCEGWYTGAGKMVITPQLGPASFEGGSWVEDAPGLSLIRDYVNGLVRSNFSLPPAVAQAVPNANCIRLGVSPAQGPNDKFAAILYDKPPRLHRHPVTPLSPTLEVTFVSLKRLVAHAPPNGNVLYSPTEKIVLDIWADYTHRTSDTLTMNENDQVNLSIAPVSFTPPYSDTLVVIANIVQQPTTSEQDSGFDSFSAAMNFSPGTHTVQIPKTYILPPGPVNRKPIIATMPGYALTYSVAFHGRPTLIGH